MPLASVAATGHLVGDRDNTIIETEIHLPQSLLSCWFRTFDVYAPRALVPRADAIALILWSPQAEVSKNAKLAKISSKSAISKKNMHISRRRLPQKMEVR